MKLKLRFNVFFVLLFSYSLAAQEDSIPKDYGLSISGLSFLKNNEYTPKRLNGYTRLGTLNRLSFFYSAGDITLEGGVILSRGSGTDTKQDKYYPRILVSFAFADYYTFKMGNIGEQNRHALPIGLLDTRYVYETIEEGFSLEYKQDAIYSELWLHWIKQIKPKDNFQEQFTIGYQWNYEKKTGKHYLKATPVQLLINHVGGEYDTLNLSILTLINSHSGIKYTYDLSQKWSAGISASLYAFDGKDFDKNHPLSSQTSDGYMWSIGTLLKYRSLTTEVMYWKNKNYFSPYAEPLFNRTATNYFQDTFSFRLRYNYSILNIMTFWFDAQLLANSDGISNYAQIFLSYDLGITHSGLSVRKKQYLSGW